MYGLYINDTLTQISHNIKLIKAVGFLLAVKGHKVAYKLMGV